jgi:ABC-type multidrug transport system ATPase subunit
MKKAIEIKNLSKQLWWNLILNSINLNIEEWAIYWFLWANGAWKTTTLKILSWILKNQVWEIKIFWENFNLKHLEKMWVLIEQSQTYEKNTWFENLKIHSLLNNNLNKKRIKEVLKLVWLDEKASKKLAKDYSLWMKQRLWIAIALLNNPKILILDEPTNWLDIEGIKEVRELLLNLAKNGTTIIISSHSLMEIEKICTHIWVINSWRIAFEWTKSQFMALWKDIEENYLSLIK